ncbi:MAG: [FeFe] hydrogenase H-cluster radical SAM maturase HydG, partial [Psychrilyobacter sp.]|nr:[FeFe] hydrogenase H-cluster radical SAM maturase HydG [Psychrilyobacter sp.]
PEKIKEMFDLAKAIKKDVYGDRVVLFAPLYLGNKCTNSCTYCGFNVENKQMTRKTLSLDELGKEIEALVDEGHKRIIQVYGTHPDYSPEYIRDTVLKTYTVKKGNGEIRRVNINAAPQTIEDFKIIKDSGIGTYQIFQETYHEASYGKVHPRGEKSNFKWRLFGLTRAMEAGIDDVGIGALFGIYKWKFEVLGLMQHVEHLEKNYNVGPHTISFPRLNEASGVDHDDQYLISDMELKRIIAILRLAVPYTGLILTARETPELRRECMELGVSQIDAGTQIELQGYSSKKNEEEQDLDKEQFKIGDSRGLDDILRELLENGFTPSFCTACYRLGRTGEHFMEFSKPGFIHNFCTPNAILTLAEYLEDYASPATKKVGYDLIENSIDTSRLSDETKESLLVKLAEVKDSKRDLYF